MQRIGNRINAAMIFTHSGAAPALGETAVWE